MRRGEIVAFGWRVELVRGCNEDAEHWNRGLWDE